MKKVITFILIIATVILPLVGCGTGTRPDDVSEEMYELGIAAIETTDEYLNGTLSGDDALDRLHWTHFSAELIIKAYKEETGSDTLVATEYWKDSIIESSILLLRYEISRKESGMGNSKSIIEKRNALADDLNEKKI